MIDPLLWESGNAARTNDFNDLLLVHVRIQPP